MLDYVIGFGSIIGYIVVGFYLTRFIRKRTSSMNPTKQLLVLSFSYTLIFGIGIAGGGGEPGFAFPAPVILAGILDVYIWSPTRIFINGVIIPLFFWWTFIFLVMLIREKLNRKFKKEVHQE